MNRGQGIKVFGTLLDIEKFISTQNSNNDWVIQKYIEKPLLYQGRKFDIRIWVVFTGESEVFIYKDGYIRTSSASYDLDAKDEFVHLTNNCLQRGGDEYGQHEDGNTLSFQTFEDYLKEAFPEYGI